MSIVNESRQRGGGAANQGQTTREADTARRGSSPQGRPAPLVGEPPVGTTDRSQPVSTPACSVAPTKGVGCRAPARGYRPRPALPPARAAALAVGVAADGQG
ncbi:hypothetical protein GW17_00036479 [Ensete ventricosum]|nr:hypothetical protein GW17_00036479 [Ensete ventricosum]